MYLHQFCYMAASIWRMEPVEQQHFNQESANKNAGCDNYDDSENDDIYIYIY